MQAPAMQAEGLDRYRHVIGVEPYWDVELEIGRDLDARSRRRGEGDQARLPWNTSTPVRNGHRGPVIVTHLRTSPRC
jgi:hypothetical protein